MDKGRRDVVALLSGRYFCRRHDAIANTAVIAATLSEGFQEQEVISDVDGACQSYLALSTISRIGDGDGP